MNDELDARLRAGSPRVTTDPARHELLRQVSERSRLHAGGSRHGARAGWFVGAGTALVVLAGAGAAFASPVGQTLRSLGAAPTPSAAAAAAGDHFGCLPRITYSEAGYATATAKPVMADAVAWLAGHKVVVTVPAGASAAAAKAEVDAWNAGNSGTRLTPAEQQTWLDGAAASMAAYQKVPQTPFILDLAAKMQVEIKTIQNGFEPTNPPLGYGSGPDFDWTAAAWQDAVGGDPKSPAVVAATPQVNAGAAQLNTELQAYLAGKGDDAGLVELHTDTVSCSAILQ
jgi:hypothetical protein